MGHKLLLYLIVILLKNDLQSLCGLQVVKRLKNGDT